MQTHCPHCQTTFRVTPEQLKVRHGQVRCSVCLAIFDALDALTEALPPSSSPSPSGKNIEGQPPTTAYATEAAFTEAMLIPAFVPDISDGTRLQERVAFGGDVAEDSAAEAADPDAGNHSEIAAEPSGSLILPPVTVAPSQSVADLTDPTVAPSQSVADLTDPTVAPSQSVTDLTDPAVAPSESVTDIMAPRMAEVLPSPMETEVTATLPPHTGPEFPPHWMTPSPPRSRRWLWGLGSACLLLLALVQSLYLFRTEIAALRPEIRPLLEAACDHLGCTVPFPHQPELITIESSDLAPGNGKELRLTATLQNRAPFAQAYPHLELTLTNAADAAVLRRVLPPRDWLPSAPQAVAFPAHGEITVALELDAGDTAATGYRLYLFFP